MNGKRRDEVIVELKSVYADESPPRARIYRWFNYFQSGRTSVFVGKSPWMPIEIDEKITESLKESVKNERKITTRELSVKIPFVSNSLVIRKLCSRFVPRFLTDEMQDRRMQCYRKNLSMLSSVGDSFLDKTLYVPESRRES